jgi:hypothetical protein
VITDTEEEHTQSNQPIMSRVRTPWNNKGARNLCYQLLTNCYCDVPSGCCVRHVVAISSIDVFRFRE